jgi:nucleoside-specific outer membrane channel protein Tsx
VFVQSGTAWSQQAELTASDGRAWDWFGSSVAVSGSTVVVGAFRHTVGSNQQQGAAYVFGQSGTTWRQQAELTASDGAEYDLFGSSVAVSGSTALVGAYYHRDGSGAAYVFVQSGTSWSQQAELIASDEASGDEFGFPVAVSGGTAAVGAVGHKVGSHVAQGAAYVFVESGGAWSQQAELTASDGVAFDEFGFSVAVIGSTAVVGAPKHPYSSFPLDSPGPGAAYVFGENAGTWSEQAELTASDGVPFDGFGDSVVINGTMALVGAPGHAVSSNQDQGAAYVFGPTSVSLTPISLSFGNEAVNTTSKAETVTLQNAGTATLDISDIAASAGFAISANACGATLAAGKKCKVSVTFTPTQLGAVTGTLNFTDNASSGPLTVYLSGTGDEQATLTRTRYTFKETKVGDTSAAHEFTLKNNLPTTLTGISYSTKAPFAISSSTCKTTLNSKKSCTISVEFKPTQTGAATGTLNVNDSANNSPQTASLAGTGD